MGSKARKRKCEIERVTEKVGENVGSREREGGEWEAERESLQ